MSKVKFGWSEYFSPTPKHFRVLGDSLAAAGTFGATIVILNGHPLAGTIIMIIGVIGKFLSNFFTEIEEEIKQSKKKT